MILHSLTIDRQRPAGRRAGRLVGPAHLPQRDGTGWCRSAPATGSPLTDLPRGAYRVKVKGGLIPLASTVRLSRDQTATELVVTTGDCRRDRGHRAGRAVGIVAAGVIGRRRRRAGARIDSEPSDAVPSTVNRTERRGGRCGAGRSRTAIGRVSGWPPGRSVGPSACGGAAAEPCRPPPPSASRPPPAVSTTTAQPPARQPGTPIPNHRMFAFYYLWWDTQHWHARLGPDYPYSANPLPLPATLSGQRLHGDQQLSPGTSSPTWRRPC